MNCKEGFHFISFQSSKRAKAHERLGTTHEAIKERERIEVLTGEAPLPVVERPLHNNNVRSKRCGTNTGHDRDEHMFLDSEGTGGKLGAKDLDVRQDFCQSMTQGKRNKQCNGLGEARDTGSKVAEKRSGPTYQLSRRNGWK